MALDGGCSSQLTMQLARRLKWKWIACFYLLAQSKEGTRSVHQPSTPSKPSTRKESTQYMSTKTTSKFNKQVHLHKGVPVCLRKPPRKLVKSKKTTSVNRPRTLSLRVQFNMLLPTSHPDPSFYNYHTQQTTFILGHNNIN